MPHTVPARHHRRNLALIRMSIVLAVAIAGGITWWLHSTGQRHPAPAPNVDLATMILWSLATGALLVLRRRRDAVREHARRRSYTILGWAAGELAAFAGVAHYFVTGNPQRFLFGMLVFTVALLVMPIPADE